MVALSVAIPDTRPVGIRPLESGPVVWVLHDGKAGMASQTLGVAEAAGFPLVEMPLTVRRPWTWAAPSLWLAPLRGVRQSGQRLLPPWPDAVIGCGRNAVRPALAIKRASGGRTIAVHVQDPRFGRDRFDLMIVPQHHRPRGPRGLGPQGGLPPGTPPRPAPARPP